MEGGGGSRSTSEKKHFPLKKNLSRSRKRKFGLSRQAKTPSDAVCSVAAASSVAFCISFSAVFQCSSSRFTLKDVSKVGARMRVRKTRLIKQRVGRNLMGGRRRRRRGFISFPTLGVGGSPSLLVRHMWEITVVNYSACMTRPATRKRRIDPLFSSDNESGWKWVALLLVVVAFVVVVVVVSVMRHAPPQFLRFQPEKNKGAPFVFAHIFCRPSRKSTSVMRLLEKEFY